MARTFRKMTRTYEVAAISALILYFIKPSSSQTTTQPKFSVSPNFMINYATRNICGPREYTSYSTKQQNPDVRLITLELHTMCQVYNYSLMDMRLLMQNDAFNYHYKVVIFAAGWSNQFLNTRVIESMARPYLCRQDNNFIGINFENYLKSIHGTFTKTNHNEIAGNLSQALEELIDLVPVENIHLIGHALGANIVSTASRFFRLKTNSTLARVTGLDPSRPCYTDFVSWMKDAKFTDILHTNSDELGIKDPLGDVDFYFGGLRPNQPGCETASCSSHRAWQYFAETAEIGGNTNMRGSRCRSWDELVEENCVNNTQVNVGYATNSGTRGIFVVRVNPKPPYGQNANRYRSYGDTCWKCKQG